MTRIAEAPVAAPSLDVERLADIAVMALGEVTTGAAYGLYHKSFREHFVARLQRADEYRALVPVASVADPERMNAMLPFPTTDAQKWTAAFRETFPDANVDDGTMLGWFANAIEHGRGPAVPVASVAGPPLGPRESADGGHMPRPTDICTVCGNGLVHIDSWRDAEPLVPVASVERLRELSEAATPGPWEYVTMKAGMADARFVIAAVNFVREALAPDATPEPES